MDQYAFYVTTKDENLWQWIPYLEEDDNGKALINEDGNYIEDPTRIEANWITLPG